MNPQKQIFFQPCMIDKLTDDHSDEKMERSRDRVVTGERYREGLLRDLLWLLNSYAHSPGESGSSAALFDFPELVDTGINYGVRQFIGQTTVDTNEMEERIKKALITYEPRLNPETLKVTAKLEGNSIRCTLSIDYWAKPQPIHELVMTEMDLETGRVELAQAG